MSVDYTPAQIMAAISAALRADDMPAVIALTHLLAIKDAASAQTILDSIEVFADLQTFADWVDGEQQ